MSTYEELKGLKVKYLSSDTSGDRIQEGEIFYNSTGFALKSFVATQAFSAGTNMTTTRGQLAGSTAGTQSANFVVGGELPPGGLSDECEEYNGNGYSIGGDLGTSRRKFAGSGTLTAGLVFGGATQPNTGKTETYDGSSFSEVNDMGTARSQHGGVGTQTAALACGGYDTARTSKTEEYNGTSWSEQNDMSIARSQLNSSVGTQTAMFVGGGNYKPGSLGYTRYNEEYDGTSWTSGGSLATGKNGAFGFGSLTVGVVTGGEIPGGSKSTTTEIYDGTAYASSSAAPATGRMSGTASGISGTTGIIQGGSPSGNLTEEFNTSILAVTAGAWTSGANFPTDIQDATGAGPTTASVVWGGYDGPAYDNETFEYDGSSWSESGDMNTARACYHVGAGSQTAALQAGGYATTAHSVASEEYNGTAWTEGNNLNVSRYSATGGGIQTSALMCGGNGDPGNSAIANNESYNGTSWSNETALPGTTAGGKQYSGTGETTSLIVGFGANGNTTLSYDGSSWTDLGHNLIEKKTTAAGGSQQGTTTAALFGGGFNPAPAITSASQIYNGTSWASSPSMATARRGGACSGTADNCLGVGGERPAQSNATEEFLGERTATSSIKTIDFD